MCKHHPSSVFIVIKGASFFALELLILLTYVFNIMQKNIPNPVQLSELVDCKAASAMLNVKVQTMAKWRANKSYPLPYVKFGKRRVCYKMSDLMNFCKTFGFAESDQQNNNNQ